MHGEEIFCLQILKSLVSGFQKLLSALIRFTCPPKLVSAAVDCLKIKAKVDVNTCADYTDEHGYARRRNFLSPNPEVSRIGVSKTFIRVHPPKSALIRVRIQSAKIPRSDKRARIHPARFAATVFIFDNPSCVISFTRWPDHGTHEDIISRRGRPMEPPSDLPDSRPPLEPNLSQNTSR